MDEPQKHFDKPKKQGTTIISYLHKDRQHSRTAPQNLSVVTCWWEGGRGERFNPSFFLFWTLESGHLPLRLCELHLPGRLLSKSQICSNSSCSLFFFWVMWCQRIEPSSIGNFPVIFSLFISKFILNSKCISVLQNLLIYGGVFYSPNAVYLTNCVICGLDRDHWVHSC